MDNLAESIRQLDWHTRSLPNDYLVEIETVYDDGYARAIRIYGDRAGTVGVRQFQNLKTRSKRLQRPDN